MDPNTGMPAGRGARAHGASLTLHLVASLDGFIARPDNSLSWLESPPDAYPPGVAEGTPADAAQAIDCFVMGSRTYEHALELGWVYGDTPTVVVTSRRLPRARPGVEFYSGDLGHLVDDVLAPRHPRMWAVGGAHLGRSLLRLGLVDWIRLTIAPVLLGDGLRLFENPGMESRWRLVDVVAYNTGFVELAYTRQRE